ncbi:hypothetical protein D8M34_06585 [Microbacterium sp. HSID17254]|nr:hypothetical protein D8M34_06585 [Microbacterium sp. HSID17254]
MEVFFPSFVAGTATVTVYRLAGGREFQMRGGVRAVTGGTLTRIDHEIPFNVPVTYRAEQFNATGQSLGFTASTEVTVASADSWMHNPLDPQGAVRVSLGTDSAVSFSRPVPGVVSRPRGRRVGVVLSEPRQGVSGLTLDVRTSTTADADAVQAMFGDDGRPPIVCVRLGELDRVMRVPQPLFLSALSVSEVDVGYRWGSGEISHPVEGDEVAPPVPGLFVPTLRAIDLNVSFATAAELNLAHLTAADVNRRYDLAGAAG